MLQLCSSIDFFSLEFCFRTFSNRIMPCNFSFSKVRILSVYMCMWPCYFIRCHWKDWGRSCLYFSQQCMLMGICVFVYTCICIHCVCMTETGARTDTLHRSDTQSTQMRYKNSSHRRNVRLLICCCLSAFFPLISLSLLPLLLLFLWNILDFRYKYVMDWKRSLRISAHLFWQFNFMFLFNWQ